MKNGWCRQWRFSGELYVNVSNRARAITTCRQVGVTSRGRTIPTQWFPGAPSVFATVNPDTFPSAWGVVVLDLAALCQTAFACMGDTPKIAHLGVRHPRWGVALEISPSLWRTIMPNLVPLRQRVQESTCKKNERRAPLTGAGEHLWEKNGPPVPLSMAQVNLVETFSFLCWIMLLFFVPQMVWSYVGGPQLDPLKALDLRGLQIYDRFWLASPRSRDMT